MCVCECAASLGHTSLCAAVGVLTPRFVGTQQVAAQMPFCLGLGTVNVEPLKKVLARELVAGRVWDPNHGNVDMFRRGHDAWGVKKAMFLYCDDGVERVLAFPWWHRRGEREAAGPGAT